MYDLFTYIGMVAGVNVGIYSVHGWFGYVKDLNCRTLPKKAQSIRRDRVYLLAFDPANRSSCGTRTNQHGSPPVVRNGSVELGKER